MSNAHKTQTNGPAYRDYFELRAKLEIQELARRDNALGLPPFSRTAGKRLHQCSKLALSNKDAAGISAATLCR